MGNTNIEVPNVNDDEAVKIRNRYKKRIASSLFVNEDAFWDVGGEQIVDNTKKNNFPLCMLIHVPEKSAQQISEKTGVDFPPHYVIISFGISWICGNELVARLPDGPDSAAMKLAETIQSDFVTMRNMQKDTPFQPNESSQVMMFRHESFPEVGDRGSALILDPILRGVNYSNEVSEEDDVNREGALHDSDYVPQHFLCVHFLRPTEYNFMSSLRVLEFSKIIGQSNPCFISSPTRIHYLKDVTIHNALKEAKARSPTKMHMDGLSMELFFRKNGRCLDIVTSGRCMAPILLALEQAFDKNPVPKGTQVGSESEGGQSIATFFCHDSNGELITPETAHFQVEILAYADGLTQALVQLGPEKEREYATLPPGTLFKDHGYIRMLRANIYAPPAMLRQMIHDMRSSVSSRRDSDWDSVPLLLEWKNYFHGSDVRGGFADKWKSDEEKGGGEEYVRKIKDQPFTFRFGCVGMGVFEDKQFINDDGVLENI